MKIKLDENAFMPSRAHPNDAGLDLYAQEDRMIYPLGYYETDALTGRKYYAPTGAIFDTGVAIQLEHGEYATVTGRSGLNMKHHIICPSGTIDEGFTGNIGVKLYNLGTEPFEVKRGMRIAQLIIQDCKHPELEVVDELDTTDRGNGGFGSTGD